MLLPIVSMKTSVSGYFRVLVLVYLYLHYGNQLETDSLHPSRSSITSLLGSVFIYLLEVI